MPMNRLKRCRRLIFTLRTSLAAGLLVGGLLGFSSVRGGEEKGQLFMDPEAEPWKFVDDGMRDPFTFIRVKEAEVKIETVESVTPKDPRIRIEQEAREKLAKAETQFKSAQYKSAITNCDEGLESISKLEKDVRLPEVSIQEIREKLYSLRTAAERLYNRKIAEQAFKQLNIKVTGVVAKNRNSLAIVNSRVVTRGDLIESTDQSGGAIVDEILPGRVILRFRGYRMELDAAQ